MLIAVVVVLAGAAYLVFGGPLTAFLTRRLLHRLQVAEGGAWGYYKRSEIRWVDLDYFVEVLKDRNAPVKRRIRAAEILAWEGEARHIEGILNAATADGPEPSDLPEVPPRSGGNVRRWMWMALAGCVRRTGVTPDIPEDRAETDWFAERGRLVALAATGNMRAAEKLRLHADSPPRNIDPAWVVDAPIEADLAWDIAARDAGFTKWKERVLSHLGQGGRVELAYFTLMDAPFIFAEEKLELLEWLLSLSLHWLDKGNAEHAQKYLREHLGISGDGASPPEPDKPPPPAPAWDQLTIESASLPGGITMRLVWIPPGTFTMGSTESGPNYDSSERPHDVTLTRGFWMALTEVTQAQWEAVMGSNPSYFKGPNRPVEQVSWDDAMVFVRRLSESSDQKFDLPTEAEWEYACRAGTRMRYSFGDSEARLGEYAWYHASGGTHDVGQKLPNTWGLYDLHANVEEWCKDWYGEYPEGPVADPQGASSGEHRVSRGGSWFNAHWYLRAAARGRNSPSMRWQLIGLRVVRR